jgi:hypothetical protein
MYLGSNSTHLHRDSLRADRLNNTLTAIVFLQKVSTKIADMAYAPIGSPLEFSPSTLFGENPKPDLYGPSRTHLPIRLVRLVANHTTQTVVKAVQIIQ